MLGSVLSPLQTSVVGLRKQECSHLIEMQCLSLKTALYVQAVVLMVTVIMLMVAVGMVSTLIYLHIYCTCTHIHTHSLIYIHLHTHFHMHTLTHYMHTLICTRPHILIHTLPYTTRSTCTCMCMQHLLFIAIITFRGRQWWPWRVWWPGGQYQPGRQKSRQWWRLCWWFRCWRQRFQF